MLASVIIPSYNRPQILARVVAALAEQTFPVDDFEVLVGLDGHDAESERAARAAWPHDPARLIIDPADHAGQAGVRNRLIAKARGRVFVFLNDDVIASPDLVRAHATDPAHNIQTHQPSIILGSTPWKIFEPDTLFRQLVRETSMVFFYHRMNEYVTQCATAHADDESSNRRAPSPRQPNPPADPRERDWGFRHAWLLNLSIRADLVRAVGGLSVFPSTYGFEDDELAWRLREKCGARVLYRPEARGLHDHRLTPEEYLLRESKLGYAAWGFAQAAPQCARELFGRDITAPGEIEYCRAYLEREAVMLAAIQGEFLALDSRPALDPTRDPTHDLAVLYQHHLPLKRARWRRGLLDAAEAPRSQPGTPAPASRAKGSS